MRISFLLLLTSLLSGSYSQIIYHNQKAPEITFDQWVNSEAGIDTLDDVPVVLEFWATWCGGCLKAIPHLNHLSERYKGEIVFISVNSYDSLSVVQKIMADKDIQTLVALDQSQFYKKELDVQGLPATFLIDKNRMLRWRGAGFELTEDILDTFLEKDTLLPVTDVNLVDAEIDLGDGSEVISVQVERIVFAEYAKSNKSLSFDFEDAYYLKLSNYMVTSVIETLIENSAIFDAQPELVFEGNVPNHYSVNFKAKSNIADKTHAISRAILNQLSKDLSFTIDTLTVPKEVTELTPDKEQLRDFLSSDQSADISISSSEGFYTFSNSTFPNFVSFINQLIGGNPFYAIPESFEDSQKYILKVPLERDAALLEKHLKGQYGIVSRKTMKNRTVLKINFQ